MDHLGSRGPSNGFLLLRGPFLGSVVNLLGFVEAAENVAELGARRQCAGEQKEDSRKKYVDFMHDLLS